MTTPTIATLVGMHFRPPAKAILQCLPKGAALRIVPEPHNQYDANALAVWVDAEAVPASEHDTLNTLAIPFGYSADDIIAQGEWQLGYIARQEAEILVGAVNEALERHALRASLAFSGDGKPRVELTFTP